MTPFPHSVAPSATLEDAAAMMRAHNIRHLPVCENQVVVGILAERDTQVAMRALSVGDVCRRDPYVVSMEAAVDQVADEMADRQITAALVTRGGKLAGILTTTDVFRLLANVIREHYVGDDDDVA